MIYLDNNATTRPTAEVVELMNVYLGEQFCNPSSVYTRALVPRKAIEHAREQVAALLGAAQPSEILFTSGGTESDNWAILGSLESCPSKTGIVTTRVEHEAVRNLCEKIELKGFEVTWLDVDEKGMLDEGQLERALNENTAVVSIMMANNETGVLFPVERLAEIVKTKSDAVFHVDGVNAAGKVPIDLKKSEIDLFSISGHKFHGPKGVGALYVRTGIDLAPLKIGGGQERGMRAGTEAVHQVAGLGLAAEYAADLRPMDEITLLRKRLEKEVLEAFAETSVNGHPEDRLPNTTNISFENLNGELILAGLDRYGICVSTGSACNEASHVSSPVLAAMNTPYSKAMGSIRFSLGRNNTEDEIETVLEVLQKVVHEIREISG